MAEYPDDKEGVDIGGKHRLGHLRVDEQGQTTFKRLPTNDLVEALQLGIQYSVGSLEAKPARDVLVHDFSTIEVIDFPRNGATTPRTTPPHRFSDFSMSSYAPVAFRHFREKFNIRPEDYLSSICQPFVELKNPGASGSLFYLTADDEFIIKTVQKKEATFLLSLLPGYYLNVTQNQRTLLPKFFGLYCYQGDNKNIRIIVMNNLIPSHIEIHEKYDLKGSKYKRQADNAERRKKLPTWKDLDFRERHSKGLFLDSDTFCALMKTVERDCRVLESFQIMDYSLLLGIHYPHLPNGLSENSPTSYHEPERQVSVQTDRRTQFTPMDNIQANSREYFPPEHADLAKTGGIPAFTADGQRIYLYIGIIDILQSYQLRKRLEHTFKSVVTDGTQISVTNPKYYSERFQKFLFNDVFKRVPSKPIKLITLPGEHTSIRSSIKTPSTTASSIRTRNGSFYKPPSHISYTSSSSTMNTCGSYYTGYGSSVRLSQQSERGGMHGSSTAFDVNSHKSDSLLNEPKKQMTPKLMTTSFNRLDNNTTISTITKPPAKPSEKPHRHVSNDGTKEKRSKTKPIASNIRPPSNPNLSEYSSRHRHENHQSSEEIKLKSNRLPFKHKLNSEMKY